MIGYSNTLNYRVQGGFDVMSLYISRYCEVIVMLFDIFAIVSFSVHRNRKGKSEVMLNMNTVLTLKPDYYYMIYHFMLITLL